jgi:hypothetical protein
MHMLLASFFSWWYGSGWKQQLSGLGPRIKSVEETFSVKQILRTLFAPWKKIISYPGDNINEKFRAFVDNMFSRAVGFVVRSIVLLAALLSIIITIILSIIEVILWPLMPLLVPILIIYGVMS